MSNAHYSLTYGGARPGAGRPRKYDYAALAARVAEGNKPAAVALEFNVPVQAVYDAGRALNVDCTLWRRGAAAQPPSANQGELK
jgi:hypothetical protein